MRLPFAVSAAFGKETHARWVYEFESFRSRDRTIEEGIWRRTQEPQNAGESGWRSQRDARRRIVHYYYKFGMIEGQATARLALTSFYLYQSLSLPTQDLNEFHDRILAALRQGGWTEARGRRAWVRDDLSCIIQRHRRHPEDALAPRELPSGYESLDVTVESASCSMPNSRRRLPWDVLSRGMRRRDTRGNPTVIQSLAQMARCLPFQIELGCGISTEAGIPPLHFLHDLYSVTNRDTGAFIFGGDADTLLTQILSSTECHVHRRAQMMHACVTAEPTRAHHILRELADRHIMLTPIITNNFDGLHARAGLSECYIRRYDEDVPDVPIYDETKALLVIGSHADRRKVQARFRDRGLPIFFLDPEGFKEDQRFISYPIEGARDGDFIRHAGAAAGLLELAKGLGLHGAY